MKTSYELTFLKEKPSLPFYEVEQIHSNKIVSLNEIKNSPNQIEADGIFWSKEQLLYGESIAIKTADCLSVYIESSTGYYLIHAGWRGVKKNIFTNIDSPQNIHILPSIKQCCFEVTSEFHNYFPCGSNFKMKNDKFFFDLTGKVMRQVLGISPSAKFNIDPRCTYCSKENFHSFRRDKTILRNYTLITNKKPGI